MYGGVIAWDRDDIVGRSGKRMVLAAGSGVRIALLLILLKPVLAAVPALAQERGGPALELGLHAGGLRGDSFSTFETRLLMGGTAIAEVSSGWRMGVGLDLVWVDQLATSYLYRAVLQRDLPSFGGVAPYVEAGVGGLTTRLDVPGASDTDSDWLVPLAAGVRWRSGPQTPWGVRVAATDFIVWEEVPCGCVEVGEGPTPETGDTSAIHNLSVSVGVLFLFGEPSR